MSWTIVKPTGTTDANYVTNPSAETDTTGWTATSGSGSRAAGVGSHGAYGFTFTASAQNGRYATATLATTSGTSNWTASCYVMSGNANTVLVLRNATDNTDLATATWTANGTRLTATASVATSKALQVWVRDTAASAWTQINFDAVQLENTSAATTYIDGDQDGCAWVGTPHGSTSTRDGRDYRGGALVTFASLGWTPKMWGGIGAPDVEAITQDLALFDGALYQNQRAKSRVITISALATAANMEALHTARGLLVSALNPNARTNRGPVRLYYTEAATDKYIDVVNESGLGFDKPYHQRAEMAELRFLAPDPMWSREVGASASLTGIQTLNPVSGLVYQRADGTWSTLAGGVAAATPARWLSGGVLLLDGRIVVSGTNYLDFGGTAANDNLAVWDGAAWATLGGAAPDAFVQALVLGNDGTLYATGGFTVIGGVSINCIAQWSPTTNAWTTVGTGGSSVGGFTALAVDPATGYLWALGHSATEPTTAGGVTINGCGYWNGSAWVAASAGLPSGWETFGSQSIEIGPDGRVYAGILTSTGATEGVYVWNGSAWVAYALVTGTGGINALLSAGGRLYVAGTFTTLGGVTVANIAAVSSSGVTSMQGGAVGGSNCSVQSLAATPDGLVHAAGREWTTIGGITPPDSVASWTGSGWLPFRANSPDTGTHANDIAIVRSLRDGSMLLGWFAASGTFATSMTVDAIATATNDGSADAYPIIDITGAGTLYGIKNLTTQQSISLSGCTLVATETVRLDLRPGRKTFRTPLRNLMSTILPGSDLSTFRLAPGVNRISIFITAGTAVMSWRTREWGAD